MIYDGSYHCIDTAFAEDNVLVKNNSLEINGGSVYYGAWTAEGFVFKPMYGNQAVVTGGYVVQVTAAENTNYKSGSFDVYNNKLDITGGYVESAYVGVRSRGSGNVYGNVANISGNDTYVKVVYGGYNSASGMVYNNTVNISGGTVGEVYASYSKNGSSSGMINITGQAEVGDAYGGTGADVILVASSKAAKVHAGKGNDIIYCGSQNNMLEGGLGSDNYYVDWTKADGVNIVEIYRSDDKNVVGLINSSKNTISLTKNGDMLVLMQGEKSMVINDWQAISAIEFLGKTDKVSVNVAAIKELADATISFSEATLAGTIVTLTNEDKDAIAKICGNA